MWHPELVGVVRAYPATQEKFDVILAISRANIAAQRAAGRWVRTGVNNGGGRRAAQIDRADTRTAKTLEKARLAEQRVARVHSHAAAMLAAPAELKRMMDENFITAETLADAELGNIALKFVTAVVMDPMANMNHRLTAVKTLIEFTKVKPATKAEIAFKNAEDFLGSLTGVE